MKPRYKYPLFLLLVLLLIGVFVFVKRAIWPEAEQLEVGDPVVVEQAPPSPRRLSSAGRKTLVPAGEQEVVLPPIPGLPKVSASQPATPAPAVATPVAVPVPVAVPTPAVATPVAVSTPAVATPVAVPVPAAPVVQAVQKPSEKVDEAFQPGIQEAEAALAADTPKLARDIAYPLLAKCQEYSGTWYALASVIDRANKIFMNSKAPCPEKATYTVASGDNLVKIANKNGTTVNGLQRMNEMKVTSSMIHPGDQLDYFTGKWSIKVSKSQFLLSLYLDGNLFRIYRVTIGAQNKTPVGTFIVNQKMMNPAWTPPGESIPFGDPRNLLGTRWIGLQSSGNTDPSLRGYGIHGTNAPETIGSAASHGCVRLLNEEVEELYDFLPSSYKKITIPVTIIE